MKYPTKYENDTWYAWNAGSKRWRKAVLITCWGCGTDFVRPNWVHKGQGYHCSQRCYQRQRKLLGLHGITPLKDRIYSICVICKRKFYVKPSHRGRHITCGNKACRGERKRQVMVEYWRKRRAAEVSA